MRMQISVACLTLVLRNGTEITSRFGRSTPCLQVPVKTGVMAQRFVSTKPEFISVLFLRHPIPHSPPTFVAGQTRSGPRAALDEVGPSRRAGRAEIGPALSVRTCRDVFVPEGRLKIAQRFNAGCAASRASESRRDD